MSNSQLEHLQALREARPYDDNTALDVVITATAQKMGIEIELPVEEIKERPAEIVEVEVKPVPVIRLPPTPVDLPPPPPPIIVELPPEVVIPDEPPGGTAPFAFYPRFEDPRFWLPWLNYHQKDFVMSRIDWLETDQGKQWLKNQQALIDSPSI